MREYSIIIKGLTSQQLKDLHHFLVVEKKEGMLSVTNYALINGQGGGLPNLYYHYGEASWVRGYHDVNEITLEDFYKKFKFRTNRID